MIQGISLSRAIIFVIELLSVLASLYLIIYYDHVLYGITVLFIVICVHFYLLVNKVKASITTIAQLVILLQTLVILYLISSQLPADSIGSNPLLSRAIDKESHHTDHHHFEKVLIEHGKNSKEHINNSSSSSKVASIIDKSLYHHERKSIYKQTDLSREIFGAALPELQVSSDFKYRESSDVRIFLKKVFHELPSDEAGFITDLKNPCWENERDGGLECLPYAYFLGLPKCGTSDLFERLKLHPTIVMPRRKEVRWFTRGEFITDATILEDENYAKESVKHGMKASGQQTERLRIGPASSIFSFTKSFENLVIAIEDHEKRKQYERASQLITIDGGPHTLWWSNQMPNGEEPPYAISIPQMLREIQPNAKFIITMTDPVVRMYSDYYFLDDDLRPVRFDPDETINKSPEQFHERAVKQVNDFNECIEETLNKIVFNNVSSMTEEMKRFRAAQVCAHNRKKFAIGGHGRLSIGLYILFIEKWLEHFSIDQFIFVNLLNYNADPSAYLDEIFSFLDLETMQMLSESERQKIVSRKRANESKIKRGDMLETTATILYDFYQPYNDLLVSYLKQAKQSRANPVDSFLWKIENRVVRKESEDIKHSDHHHKHGIPHPEDDDAAGEIQHELEIQRHRMEMERGHRPANRDHPIDPMRKDASTSEVEDRGRGRKKESRMNRDLDSMQPLDLQPKRHNHKELDSRLRGSKAKVPVDTDVYKVTPRRFDISDLPMRKSSGYVFEHIDQKIDLVGAKENKGKAVEALCVAVFSLDLKLLEELLYTIGVPVTIGNNDRNIWKCLGWVSAHADANAKGLVFPILKNEPHWAQQLMDPPFKGLVYSLRSNDVLDRLDKAIGDVIKWLIKAGFGTKAQINEVDNDGYTPLIVAAKGGMVGLVKALIDLGADVNAVDNMKRTAATYAAAEGNKAMLRLLVDANADLHIQDVNGVTAHEIISKPGAISAETALSLGITQSEVKTIERMINPELNTTSKNGWPAGTGGWEAKRVKGFETDMHCDVDQYWANEVDGDLVYHYLARNTPILIRGAYDHWDLIKESAKGRISDKWGDMEVQVSAIPYAKKYGGPPEKLMLIKDYIKSVSDHDVVGGEYPWYVFKGHPIPSLSDNVDSPVKYKSCPTPLAVQRAFEMLGEDMMDEYDVEDLDSRSIFVNAQWALGCLGTGAPVHFHNAAWNAILYGAKKWFIYPPSEKILSHRQIYEYTKTDLIEFEKRGIHHRSCVQTAGDLLIIPESWGHGVLNIQDSVALATEVRDPVYRIHAPSKLMSYAPTDNRKNIERERERERKGRQPPRGV